MFHRFLNEESGQGMVEYGLILGLIAIVAIAALTATGGSLGNIFNSISSEVSSAQTNMGSGTG